MPRERIPRNSSWIKTVNLSTKMKIAMMIGLGSRRVLGRVMNFIDGMVEEMECAELGEGLC